MKKVLISQKDPVNMDSGKLALKKWRIVSIEAAIIPAPEMKLQKRPKPLPSSVKDLFIRSLLCLKFRYFIKEKNLLSQNC